MTGSSAATPAGQLPASSIGQKGLARLERLRADLELIDRDIDERYFEIAALAAVHL
jgi:hypothetical protein